MKSLPEIVKDNEPEVVYAYVVFRGAGDDSHEIAVAVFDDEYAAKEWVSREATPSWYSIEYGGDTPNVNYFGTAYTIRGVRKP